MLDRQGAADAVQRWIVARAVAERSRWPLWIPVFFALGIALYFGLGDEPSLWLGTGATLALALTLLALRRHLPWRPAGLALLLVASGFAVAQLRSAWIEAPKLERPWGAGVLQAEVLSAEPRARGWRFLLRPTFMDGLDPAQMPLKVRVTAQHVDEAFRPRQLVELRARLRPPSPPTWPGGFDFARQAYFQQIGGIGFALGKLRPLSPAEAVDSGEEAGGWRSWSLFWAAARLTIAERIMTVLPDQAGAIAVALVTGQRGAIAEDAREDMRAAGLAHLLAISGLHMGLVAGLLFFAVRACLAAWPRLALRHPIKKWAACAAGLGGFVYLCLVGGAIPAQRAFLMIALVLLAVLLDRRAISLRLVAWAAMVVLLLVPESLVSASFQMSFAAVVALVALYETWDHRRLAGDWDRGVAHRFWLYVLGIAVTSLVAILATSAFAAFHFQRIAAFGLLANLLAVPLTAFLIMPAAVLGMLLMPLGLEALGFVPMGWGIELLLAIASAVADLPAAMVQVPTMPLWGLALVTLGGLWLCLWQTTWRYWGLLVLLLGAVSPATTVPPDILVSGDGRLVALRDDDRRLWLPDRRGSRFVIDSWRRGSFAKELRSWPQQNQAGSGQLSCDPLGCLFRKDGKVAAVSRDLSAVADDCAKADVLISLEPLRRQTCGGPALAVDRFDLWRQGAHAFWLTQSGPRSTTVAETQGRRPWSSFDENPAPQRSRASQ